MGNTNGHSISNKPRDLYKHFVVPIWLLLEHSQFKFFASEQILYWLIPHDIWGVKFTDFKIKLHGWTLFAVLRKHNILFPKHLPSHLFQFLLYNVGVCLSWDLLDLFPTIKKMCWMRGKLHQRFYVMIFFLFFSECSCKAKFNFSGMNS